MANYPENFEVKIGFDQIRNLLSQKCLSKLGCEQVEQMSYTTEPKALRQSLTQVSEFINILNEDSGFPDQCFFDLRSDISRLRIDGTWLDESTLFDLKRSLQTIMEIVGLLKKEKESNLCYPELSELTADLITFPQFIQAIDRILDKYGRVKDNASPELAHIRKELISVANSISSNLHTILRSAQKDGLAEKDSMPVMRDGRLVIPIIPAYKRKISGIVHDESATGKTVYIEPAQVVEANNRVRELEREEHKEIVKILTVFANTLRPNLDELFSSYHFLGTIDFIRAKALLSIELNAIIPDMVAEPYIDWKKAKHPLLLLNLKKQQKEVIPLDIKLNKDNRILIISGPNAGGKSVCLKTVGLLQYMFQCGLPIPADPTTQMGIFENIFIDIGDEQSIENDLSTYSSHLMNMKFFVKNGRQSSLILIDEFGSGTEPRIGGAIAEALLKRFNQNGNFGVITTHYQNIKHLASETEGLLNGAMLYDRHELKPLYVLSIGNPGSSFAIEIARKIGLPEDIIADATEMVGADYVNMDKYLQDIVRDKRYWEKKRQEIRQKEKRAEQAAEQFESERENIQKQRKQLLNEAKDEANRLLKEANAKIENTIRGIKESQAEKERVKDLRKNLNEYKATLEDSTTNKKENKTNSPKRNPESKQNTRKAEEQALHKTIEVGDNVKIKGQSNIGEVIELKKNTAIIAFGSIKTNVKTELLEYVKSKPKSQKANSVTAVIGDDIRDRKLTFKQDIDVRGMRAEEALQAVMYFIDDAILVSMSRVRILHGTGTGALRQAIRQYLDTVPGVHHYQDEHVQFGGAGITVVDLT